MNKETKKLLDYGFATYSAYNTEGEHLPRAAVIGGKTENVSLRIDPISLLLEKGKAKRVEVQICLPESLRAPIAIGDVVGYAEYSVDGEVVAKADIRATEDVQQISYRDLLYRLLRGMIGAFEDETD